MSAFYGFLTQPRWESDEGKELAGPGGNQHQISDGGRCAQEAPPALEPGGRPGRVREEFLQKGLLDQKQLAEQSGEKDFHGRGIRMQKKETTRRESTWHLLG